VTDQLEDLATYRERVRTYMEENLPRRNHDNPWHPMEDDDARASINRDLQRRLFDGGFAGVCYPTQYGGQGLPIAYQRVVDDVSEDFDMPLLFSTPTMSITGPTVLEFGTEQQKQRYIPAFLRGDELWVQFMSEPSGGSDMAGALTRADRDGDVFILNGSKIWSTYAYRSDIALCLVRTNWEVPKHRGLSMLIVPIHHEGITVNQIKMVDGTEEFCEEFFDDAVIPAENLVGAVDDGWTVATRLLFHERAAVGGSSPYTQGRYRQTGDAGRDRIASIARRAGRAGDPVAQQLIGQAEVLNVVQRSLIDRVRAGIESGYFPGPAGSLVRLFGGLAEVERTSISLELAGESALVWDPETKVTHGVDYIRRQASCLGGGSTEMARNLISERILNMPREHAADRGVAFREVKRNAPR
jgi:alkylation response protein AidB-like acyl-CoA dehydrogenase